MPRSLAAKPSSSGDGVFTGELMGFRLTAVSRGRVCFSGSPAFAVCNPLGTVHGGWYGTFLDSAMACAFMTTLPRGAGYTTLEFKVNITRGIGLGTMVEAVGTVQHAGTTTGVACGTIVGSADQRIYATGSTTCIVLQPRAKTTEPQTNA
ncbi:MAG: PaaI family thioesterase [Paracoccaceae bacterium]|nr:PaaI family thioesterase [Paracoccaceae bacterium]